MTSVYLQIDDPGLKKKIGKEVKAEITELVKTISGESSTFIKTLIRNITIKSPEYQSITGLDGTGKLRGEFGLDDSMVNFFTSNVHDFFQVVRKDTKSSNARIGRGLEVRGGFKAFIDYNSVPLYTYFIENGSAIPWMDWLLFRGTSVQVSGWNVRRKEGLGRSGLAVMRQGSSAAGRSYSVSSEFSGTVDDNFLTRILGFAALKAESIIQKKINEEI